MKKILITALCLLLIVTVGSGSFPQRAHAGGIINIIAGFIAAPLMLLDPLTSLVILDAFTCKVNIVWGCDKNGNPLPEPIPVVTLNAPATVELPNPVTLTWTSNARAVSCTASNGWSGSKALSGTESVIDPTGPASLGMHNYVLSCKNSEGNSGTATSSTVVIGPSVSISAPAAVEVPNPVTLSWISQNTVSCIASGDWSGNKNVSGSETVISPTNISSRGTHTYGMTCVNGSNYPAIASASVKVIQVPKCDFAADPTTITPPQSSQLAWTCKYATSCSIDHRVGSVDPVSGTRKVLPSTTTTYALNCQGLDGSRTFEATVSVPGTGGATTTPRVREVLP